ncbi:hypothetical protein T05_4433, partial [Trichinella murrelli]
MMIDCMFGDRDVMQLNSHDSNAIFILSLQIQKFIKENSRVSDIFYKPYA